MIWQPMQCAPRDKPIVAAWVCAETGEMQVSGDVYFHRGQWISRSEGLVTPNCWMPVPELQTDASAKRVAFKLRMRENLHEVLRALAEREGRSLNDTIVRILEQAVGVGVVQLGTGLNGVHTIDSRDGAII